MKKEFNQLEYIKEYNRMHYKTFKISLSTEEWEELNYILTYYKISKPQFLRNSIMEFKKKKGLIGMFRAEKKYNHIISSKVGELFTEEEVKDFIEEEIAKNYSSDEELFNEYLNESLEDLKNGRVEVGDLVFIKIEE